MEIKILVKLFYVIEFCKVVCGQVSTWCSWRRGSAWRRGRSTASTRPQRGTTSSRRLRPGELNLKVVHRLIRLAEERYHFDQIRIRIQFVEGYRSNGFYSCTLLFMHFDSDPGRQNYQKQLIFGMGGGWVVKSNKKPRLFYMKVFKTELIFFCRIVDISSRLFCFVNIYPLTVTPQYLVIKVLIYSVQLFR